MMKREYPTNPNLKAALNGTMVQQLCWQCCMDLADVLR